jgi:hypothetical protein
MARLYACEARPISRRARNPLMYNRSDSGCFMKNDNDFNVMRWVLIAPIPGSNPGAPPN